MQTLRWLLGDLDVASYTPIVVALPMLVVAITAFLVLAPRLNLLSVSIDAAAMRGVDVVRTQRISFLSASLATGAAVSIGGPIGFVGIIVPHLVAIDRGAGSSSCPASLARLRRGLSGGV